MRMVCRCQPGTEGEAGARAGPRGPEEDEGRAYRRARSGRPGSPATASRTRVRAAPSWSGEHSPFRRRPRPAVPPGTGPPPAPWAAAAPAGGGSPQPRSPGRRVGGGGQRAGPAGASPNASRGVPTGGGKSLLRAEGAQGCCRWGISRGGGGGGGLAQHSGWRVSRCAQLGVPGFGWAITVCVGGGPLCLGWGAA